MPKRNISKHDDDDAQEESNKKGKQDSTHQQQQRPPIPVTILSGFLGSGKTTLMKYVLTSPDHGLKIAVIVNDMAELNIDGQTIHKVVVNNNNNKQTNSRDTLTSHNSKRAVAPEVVTLENGCICCNLRGDLIREIYNLYNDETQEFDYILIESTGIAEPQQVAESFCVDPETMALALQKSNSNNHNNGTDNDDDDDGDDPLEESRMLLNSARLDTCVTVVDAVHFPKYLNSLKRFKDMFTDGLDDVDEEMEGEKSISELLVEQVEFANLILLNKADLVSEQELETSYKLINSLNPTAKVVTGSYGKVDVRQLLNTGLFNLKEASESPGWLVSLRNHGVNGAAGEAEEYGVNSFVYRARKPFHPKRLYAWLSELFCFAEDWNSTNSNSSNKNHLESKFNGAQSSKNAKLYGSILRSKGTCWIAGRDDHEMEWAQTGLIVKLHSVRAWNCKTPRDEWGFETDDELETMQSLFMKTDETNGKETPYPFGDRRQEIVFIGTDLKKEAIQHALEQCLLTDDDEMKSHHTNLAHGTYPDPLLPTLIVCDGPRSVFCIARPGQNQHFYITQACCHTIQNLALCVMDSTTCIEAGGGSIRGVRVWLDKTDDVAKGILLATLTPLSHEQQSMSITLMPCDVKGGEEATNRRLRIEIIGRDPSSFDMESCEVHVFGKVEPIPYGEGDHGDGGDDDDDEDSQATPVTVQTDCDDC